MNNSVKSKIYLIAGIPLLVALLFMANAIVEKYSVMTEMETLEPTTQLGIHIGALVHETQKERGATAGLLSSGDERFAKALIEQRKLTDEKRAALRDYLAGFDRSVYEDRFLNVLDAAITELDKMDGIRSQIDAKSISTKEAIGYYTGHNTAMLNVVQATVEIATNAEISQLRSAYVNFMQGKERAGIERAVMSTVFGADEFKGSNFTKFLELTTIQDTYLKVFSSLALPSQLSFFNEQMADPSIAEVQRMRDVASSKIRNIEKAHMLADLNEEFGYGGAIHQFNNYILRGDEKYRQAAANKLADVLEVIETYEKHPQTSAEEKGLLATIAGVVKQYQAALPKIHSLLLTGVSATEIERQVRISDDAALKALVGLEKGAAMGHFGIDAKYWFDTITKKINHLKAVEDRLASDLGSRGGELYGEAQAALWTIIIVAVAVVVAILATVIFVSRGIINGMAQSVTVAERIAAGDLSAEVVVDRKDELGQLQQAMSTMRDTLVQMIISISSAADQVSGAAQDMSAITAQTSAGIQKQQAETEQVATAMNQMAATVDEVANSAANAAEGAKEADQAAQTGQQVVDDTIRVVEQVAGSVESNVEVVRQVNEDSKRIGMVLDVIRDIAEQTNLLALNAAIEAARAGEHGRGFAVVADEVRTLASRTQESTEEIQNMIQGLQHGASAAVEAMEEGASQAREGSAKAAGAREALEAITRTVATINDMNSQIASASEEQSAVAKEIDGRVANISHVAMETSEGAEHLSEASRNLEALSVNLKQMLTEFKV